MLRLMVLLAALSASMHGFAAEVIGQVILSVGDNQAVNSKGVTRTLKRGSNVYEEERVETGERGRVHIRFTDGSRINMKPETTLQLAHFEFSSREPESGEAVFQLLRGGLRTITGKIGKSNPENYKFQSVLATIGIRGTVYEVYVCDRCCAEQNQVNEGMAGGVERGGITVDALVGKADVDAGKFFELSKDADELMVTDTRPAMLAIGDVGPYIKPKTLQQPVPAPLEEESLEDTRCEGITDYGVSNTGVEDIWFVCNKSVADQ